MSDSESSNTTAPVTTNTDNRSINDASNGGILLGNGAFFNNDNSIKLSSYDFSNRSTNLTSYDSSNRSTNFFDSSNRSTNFFDSSNRSTNLSTTTIDSSVHNTSIVNTDYGAIAAGSDLAKSALTLSQANTAKTLDAAAILQMNSLSAAGKSQQFAFEAAGKAQSDAYKFAAGSQEGAFSSMKKAIDSVMQAYTGAKGDANASSETMKMAVAGAIGVAAVAIIFRK